MGHKFFQRLWEMNIIFPFSHGNCEFLYRFDRTLTAQHVSSWTFETLSERLLSKTFGFSLGCPLLTQLFLKYKQNVFNCYRPALASASLEASSDQDKVPSYPGTRLQDTFHLLVNSTDKFLQKSARQDHIRVDVLFTCKGT